MTQIVSQDFRFATPQQGATLTTQPWSASSVPLDGSSSVVVPFLDPFAQYCNAVNPQYNPNALTGYVLAPEITDVTTQGFTLTVYGGPSGMTGPFFGTATGI